MAKPVREVLSPSEAVSAFPNPTGDYVPLDFAKLTLDRNTRRRDGSDLYGPDMKGSPALTNTAGPQAEIYMNTRMIRDAGADPGMVLRHEGVHGSQKARPNYLGADGIFQNRVLTAPATATLSRAMYSDQDLAKPVIPNDRYEYLTGNQLEAGPVLSEIGLRKINQAAWPDDAKKSAAHLMYPNNNLIGPSVPDAPAPRQQPQPNFVQGLRRAMRAFTSY